MSCCLGMFETKHEALLHASSIEKPKDDKPYKFRATQCKECGCWDVQRRYRRS